MGLQREYYLRFPMAYEMLSDAHARYVMFEKMSYLGY